MIAMEVILLIAGFICVCVSFFIGKKKNGESDDKGPESYSRQIWSDNDDEVVKNRIDDIVNERLADVIDSADELLNRKSNEKLLEFEEYASQVLERVEKNQEEVVFMYNMLLEKENDVKPIVAAKGTNSGVKNIAIGTNVSQKMSESQRMNGAEKKKKEEKEEGLSKEQIQALERIGNSKNKDNKNMRPVDKEIIKMYKEGKSVVEISKALGIGQGEVRLIISVHGGKV